MTTITFDTLQFVRRLKAAGVPEAQAEAIAESLKDAQGELVTKDYLDHRLDVLEHRFTTKFHQALLVQTFALVAAVAALVKLL